ncbi:MAG: hydroxyacid dehydrogenase [Actinobacteria bacterium]|nr:MAG: hydroxyacid dehydrogenase [Actinomycetota bacterium]
MSTRVWLGPETNPVVAEAVERGGGEPAETPAAAEAIVWLDWRPRDELTGLLHPGIRWVQLSSAGVDGWLEQGLIDDERVWTGAQGSYAPDVAEHVVGFLLAAARRFPQAARRREWVRARVSASPGRRSGSSAPGASAGRRSPASLEGADGSLGPDGLDELLAESAYAVLTAPLTPETRGLIGARELDLLGPSGWLINVGRGPLVVTGDLVSALEEGRIAGTCLDVVDPEPLPAGHPLWTFDNVLITPHVANPPEAQWELLADRVAENVERFAAGYELVGVIDPARGY